jgi:KaiC/GvpD/RAD55 family RecA-like ATPase
MNKGQRGPIANLEAEQSVLGAVLVRPECLEEIASILSADSFYSESHGLIFRAMLDLQEMGQPVDLVTVTFLLRDRVQLEKVGGPVFLAGLSEEVGFAVNGPHYAHLVRNKYLVRQLAARAREIFENCSRFNSNGNIADLFLFAESQIHDSASQLNFEEPKLVSAQELLAKDFSQSIPIIGGGLLPEGCSLMIAGESGEGKSMLRLEMALHLALGRDLWGLEIPRPRRVLIIQFENIEQLEQVRLKRMLRGLKAECPENLLFSSPLARYDLVEKGDRARLIAAIQKSQAEVVMYDPLSSLHRVNENDNAQMRWIMDNLTEINRRTGTTAIVVHHYGKPGKEEAAGMYRTRGASSIRDWADTLLGFSRKNHEDLVLRSLQFIKVRNGPEPKLIILSRDKESFLHQVSDGDTICSPAKVRAILEGFGGQAERKKLLRAIQAAVGCQERRARDFLQDAINQGSIRVEDHPTDKRMKIYKVK